MGFLKIFHLELKLLAQLKLKRRESPQPHGQLLFFRSQPKVLKALAQTHSLCLFFKKSPHEIFRERAVLPPYFLVEGYLPSKDV
jgi:hypothetical protein